MKLFGCSIILLLLSISLGSVDSLSVRGTSKKNEKIIMSNEITEKSTEQGGIAVASSNSIAASSAIQTKVNANTDLQLGVEAKANSKTRELNLMQIQATAEFELEKKKYEIDKANALAELIF